MTCERWPTTTEAELLSALGELSPNEILSATGKTEAAFRKVCNPNNPRALQFEDAAGLDAALKSRGLPQRFRPVFDALVNFKSEPSHPSQSIQQRMRNAVKALGKLHEEFDKAVADGVLDDAELRAIAEQAAQLKKEAGAVVQVCNHLKSKPKRRRAVGND